MKYFLIQLAAGLLTPGEGEDQVNNLPTLNGDQLLQNGLNLAYFIAGAAAVIIIIVAGIMYAVSTGDQSRIAKAKQMIIYAVAGLVIILSAFAITNFVIGRF